MSAPDPFISIVIPVRDRAGEIRRCLAAAAAVDYLPKEIIVVDDASSIPLREDELPGSCTVIRFDQPCGPSVARNAGAQAARGSIVLFLDSDCILNRDALTIVDCLARQYPEMAVFNGIYVTPPSSENTANRFAALEMNFCFLNPPPTVFTALSAIRREVFMETGGFDESLDSPFADDVLLGWKLEELGYKTMFDYSLRALHLKQYTFSSYLANSFEHHAVITCVFLREMREADQGNRLEGENGFSMPIVSSRRPMNLAIFTATALWMIWRFVSGLFGCSRRRTDSFPWLLLATVIINNNKLFLYLGKQMGWTQAVLSIPLMIADIIASSAGFFAGLLRSIDDRGNPTEGRVE